MYIDIFINLCIHWKKFQSALAVEGIRSVVIDPPLVGDLST